MPGFDQFAWVGICTLADVTQMSCSHTELQFLSTLTVGSVGTNLASPLCSEDIASKGR